MCTHPHTRSLCHRKNELSASLQSRTVDGESEEDFSIIVVSLEHRASGHALRRTEWADHCNDAGTKTSEGACASRSSCDSQHRYEIHVRGTLLKRLVDRNLIAEDGPGPCTAGAVLGSYAIDAGQRGATEL